LYALPITTWYWPFFDACVPPVAPRLCSVDGSSSFSACYAHQKNIPSINPTSVVLALPAEFVRFTPFPVVQFDVSVEILAAPTAPGGIQLGRHLLGNDCVAIAGGIYPTAFILK